MYSIAHISVYSQQRIAQLIHAVLLCQQICNAEDYKSGCSLRMLPYIQPRLLPSLLDAMSSADVGDKRLALLSLSTKVSSACCWIVQACDLARFVDYSH